MLNIKPENPEEYVKMVFEAFPSWDAEDLVNFDGMGRIPDLSLPMKLGDIIRKEVDLVGIPRRQFFTILAEFSTDEIEKERLLEFAASDGTDERWDYANRVRRSLAEALADFPKSIARVAADYSTACHNLTRFSMPKMSSYGDLL